MNEQDTEGIVDDQPEGGGRVGHVLKTVIVSLVIGVLALGVLYLLSERNARRYFLVAEGGHLLVQRGIFFPVGERRFTPEDPDFAAAYPPIPVPAGEEVEQRTSFDERTDLDRVLVDQLLTWSKERIDPDQPERLEQGIYYLRRAESLPTTTATQRDEMEVLRGEVAYHEGRRFIESALRNLDTARERLIQARDSPAGWGMESRQLLLAISEPESALRRALREAEEVPPETLEPAEEEPAPDEPVGEGEDEEPSPADAEPQPREADRTEPAARPSEVRPAVDPRREWAPPSRRKQPPPERRKAPSEDTGATDDEAGDEPGMQREARGVHEDADEPPDPAEDDEAGSPPLQGIVPTPSSEDAPASGED